MNFAADILGAPHRRHLRLVEPETAPIPGGPTPPTFTPPVVVPPAPATFTQADIDAALARQKAELDEAAKAEKAKADIEALEGAEKILAQAKLAEDTAAAKVATAERTTAEALATHALVAAGCPVANLADVVRLLDIDPATDTLETLTTKAEAKKAALPALFTATATPPPPAGVPPVGGQPGAPGGKTGVQAGAERFAQRHPKPATNAA